jgi:hypothetical protein
MEYFKGKINEFEKRVITRILETCVEASMNLRRVSKLELT